MNNNVVLVSTTCMNQPFSAAMLSVAVILLIIVMVSTPMLTCGLHPVELPITVKPDKFGKFVRDDSVSIKRDRMRYFEQDWVQDFRERETEIRNATRIVLHADSRLSFGVVRKTLIELSEYRRDGIVLSTEEQYLEMEPSAFQEYLNRRSDFCRCIW